MPAGFTYDPAMLEQASRDIANGSLSVEAVLGTLTSKLEVLHEGFQGDAGEGFQQLWGQWHESAARLKASLDALSQLLHGASQSAAQMEEANRRLLRG